MDNRIFMGNYLVVESVQNVKKFGFEPKQCVKEELLEDFLTDEFNLEYLSYTELKNLNLPDDFYLRVLTKVYDIGYIAKQILKDCSSNYVLEDEIEEDGKWYITLVDKNKPSKRIKLKVDDNFLKDEVFYAIITKELGFCKLDVELEMVNKFGELIRNETVKHYYSKYQIYEFLTRYKKFFRNIGEIEEFVRNFLKEFDLKNSEVIFRISY